MQNKIKFLDESNISFKIENSMLEVYDQYDELIGSQPLPIPYDENMSGDEIYQKAEECGYDIDDMISDIVKKAIEDTKQYDFWLSDDVVIFYSPSKQCCTSEPYEGVFAKLKEIYIEEKKNFELGIDNVKTENLDCPIEDNEESLISEDEIDETVPTNIETEPVIDETPVLEEETEEVVIEKQVAPILEKKEVPMPKPKTPQPQPEKKPQQNNQPQPKQNNQPKPEEKKPQQNNQPQPKQNNQPKPEEKKPQQNNQPQPKQNNQPRPEEKKPQQNNQPQPKQNNQSTTAQVQNSANREITFCVPTDSQKMNDFKAAISAIATYNAKNSDGKIGEVANMVVQLIEQKNINPSNANEKDLVYDLALNNVTIVEGLSPVRAGIYKAMLLKELKNLGF